MGLSAQQQRAVTSGGLMRVSTQLRMTQLQRIDAMAERDGLSRAATISRLIDRGLDSEECAVA